MLKRLAETLNNLLTSDHATNAVGNTGLSTGISAGTLGVLSENYDIIMMGIAFTGLVVGIAFKWLHYRLEKKKFEHESRANH